MNIVKLPYKDRAKLVLGLPSMGIVEVCNVVLAHNEFTGNYAIVKCRYDLDEVDISKIGYEKVDTAIRYEELQDVEMGLSGKNVILTKNVFKTRDSIEVLKTI